MRLYLIRHPQPLVAPGICYGRTDIAVSIGERTRVAAALLKQLPRGVPVVTSPALRCTGLADVLAEALGGEPALCEPRLAEMNFGDWEMRLWDHIPRKEIDAWAANLVGYRPGGGETVLEVATRVQAFHAQSREREAIVVCHAGSIRLLKACNPSLSLGEIAFNAAHAPHRIGYGDIAILE